MIPQTAVETIGEPFTHVPVFDDGRDPTTIRDAYTAAMVMITPQD